MERYVIWTWLIVGMLAFTWSCDDDESNGDDKNWFEDEKQLYQLNCDNLDFSACGGDLVGSWKVIETCDLENTDDDTVLVNPFADEDNCKDAVVEWDNTLSSTMDFDLDGNYKSEWDVVDTKTHYEFDEDCLEEISSLKTDLESVCEELKTEEDFDVCRYKAGVCSCDSPTISQNPVLRSVATGSYSIEGSTATMAREGSSSQKMEFCVSGDTAILETPKSSEPGSGVTYLILQRSL